MKDNQTHYSDFDRILRIIYQELTLTHFKIPIELSSSSEWIKAFDFDNSIFVKKIYGKYFELYPDNYDQDDLDSLFANLQRELRKHYNSTNSIYLIFLIAKEIFKKSKNQLYVDFNDLLEWDGLKNKLDNKLLIAAYEIENIYSNDANFTNASIKHNNKELYSLINKHGISENHMHLNASGYTEEINWFYFLNRDFSDEEGYRTLLKEEGIFNKHAKTEAYLNDKLQFILKFKLVRLILSDSICLGGKSEAVKVFKNNIDRILSSKDVIITLNSLGIFDDMVRIEDRQKDFWEVAFQDDLDKYFKIEYDFLNTIMEYIFSNKEESKWITFLFNLYVSGMSLLKFQFIHDNKGMGFSKFKNKEENKSYFVDKPEGKQIIKQSVFHKYYNEKYVKKLEIRVSPRESTLAYFELLDELREYNKLEYKAALKKDNELSPIKFGVVIHFIKTLRPKNMSIVEDLKRKREKFHQQADILIEAINEINEINETNLSNDATIVGIDTANYEIDNRPELFGPIYRKIRNGISNGYVLNATYHVGEDFPTLSNGLRAVDEVLRFLEYRPNDRLGHALAVGIDPRKYYKVKKYNLFCSIGEYLDDLVWMYLMLLEEDKATSLLLYLREEFEKNKYKLFQSSHSFVNVPSFEDYLAAYQLRGDSPEAHLESLSEEENSYDRLIYQRNNFNESDKNHKNAFLNRNARELFIQYSFDETFRECASQPFHTKITEKYMQCVQKVQILLKQKIVKMRVYIEANPTSNRKISYMRKYSEIPAIQLSSLSKLEEGSNIKIPHSINTDDSSVFQTNLVNEYSSLVASLLREDYSETEVYNYIEELIIDSNTHSFID